MKFAYFSLGLLSLFAPLAAAWSKEDREIFRIRDEIMAHEADPAATFYDILGVPPSASLDDISKAYRLKSRALHPDKVKQQLRSDRVKAASKDGAKRSASTSPSASEVRAAVKRASERQARLSLIANILRGPLRTRYDHFLAHGFPLWKGTDYYYSRYRPGLGTVMAGLFAICGGAIHYLVLYMSWKRQREFVERYVKYARDAAWGSALSVPSMESAYAANQDQSDDDEGPPMPMNRRQRRMQDKESKREDGRSRNKKSSRRNQGSSSTASAAAAGPRKRVMAENGKVLVVDSLGSVFLEEEDEDGGVVEFLLDPDELRRPTFRDTAVIRFPNWLLEVALGRFSQKSSPASEDELDEAEEDSDGPARTPSTDSTGGDYEMVDKSTDSLKKAKTTGAHQKENPKRRTGRKR